MDDREMIVKELENAGLEVQTLVGQVPRGVLVLCDEWSRGYVYPTKDGKSWGWVSEDLLFSKLTSDEIAKCLSDTRCGISTDEPVIGKDRPVFVINRASKDALLSFVKLIRVLATVDPAIVERWREALKV